MTRVISIVLLLLLLASSTAFAQQSESSGVLFRIERLNALVLLVVFSSVVLYFIRRARRDPNLFIRKLTGLDAVDEAVGRATEMGRPVLFVPGIDELDQIQTVAGLSILSRVASVTAEYDTALMVPILYPLAFAAGQDIVKQAYINAGKKDSYRDDMVRYVAGEQLAFAAAVNGIQLRDKPAANIFMGGFYAESLILAETGNFTGAIQIAGTANPEQLPFFIASCDYTIMGEELYAASAYLSREPLLLGSLKGQDLIKLLIVVTLAIGAILATAASSTWFTEMFKAV
jgi:hypothetical protein